MSIQDLSFQFLDRVCRFAQSSRVPISKYLKHIYRHEGPKGLITRAKVIYSWYLQILAGNFVYVKEFWAIDRLGGVNYPSLKYAHKLNVLFASAIERNDYKYICAVLDVIKFYSFIEGPDLSDYAKMLRDDIFYTKPDLPPNAADFLKELKATVSEITKVKFTFDPNKDLKWVYTSSSVLLDHEGREDRTGDVATYAFLYDREIQNNGFLVDRYKDLCRSDRPFGKLIAIGEGGYKTRIVAVMALADSSICRPVHNFLQDMLAAIPNDCLKDQEKGRKYIEERTAKRLFLSSIDLRQASWHIPCIWLTTVGKELGIPFGILKYFTDTVFFYNDAAGKRHIGEPTCAAMGLPGTFPLFSFTLHVVIRTLMRLNLVCDTDCYRLLGDDIVISSRRVADALTRLFEIWKIPVSKHKCFSSTRLAEFAGTIYYKGHDITPVKWSVMSEASINAAYRGQPLLKRYIERFGRHVDMLLKPTSSISQINRRIEKAKGKKKEILERRKKAGGLNNISYSFYLDMVRLFSLLPSTLGGFLGQPTNGYLSGILKDKKAMLGCACRYLEAYIDSLDSFDEINVFRSLPSCYSYDYKTFWEISLEQDVDAPLDGFLAFMMEKTEKKLTSKERRKKKKNDYFRFLSSLKVMTADPEQTRGRIDLSVTVPAAETVSSNIVKIKLNDFNKNEGLLIPVVPLLRDTLSKPVTGFAKELLARSKGRIKIKDSQTSLTWSRYQRLIKRASLIRRIKDAETYSLGSQHQFIWDRLYLSIRPVKRR